MPHAVQAKTEFLFFCKFHFHSKKMCSQSPQKSSQFIDPEVNINSFVENLKARLEKVSSLMKT